MSVFDGLKMPKVIYETDSELNGHIRIVEVGSTRKLVVENTIQSISSNSPSCSKLYWGQLVDSLEKRMPEINNVLILGLGGGTVAHLLSKKFPGVQITSVEYDEIMVEMAKRFFDLDSIPNHKMIVDDALRVVVEPEENDMYPGCFDVLIVDILNGDNYPDLGRTGNFIAAAKRLVKKGGLLIFNRIYTKNYQEDSNIFKDGLYDYVEDIDTEIVAGYTNSDNILIFGRV
jgi:spermidine synthase